MMGVVRIAGQQIPTWPALVLWASMALSACFSPRTGPPPPPLPSSPANLVPALTRVIRMGDYRSLQRLLTPRCRASSLPALPRPLHGDERSGLVRWVPTLRPGGVAQSLGALFFTYRPLEYLEIKTLSSRQVGRWAALRLRFLLAGQGPQRLRRTDQGTVDLELVQSARGWRIDDLRWGPVHSAWRRSVAETASPMACAAAGLGDQPDGDPDAWTVLDLDGDRRDDVILARDGRVMTTARLSEDQQGPALLFDLGRGRRVTVLRPGDFTGDGLPELFVGRDDGGFSGLRGTGDSEHAPLSIPTGGRIGGPVRDAVVADFDGDGLVDLFVVRGGSRARPAPDVLLLGCKEGLRPARRQFAAEPGLAVCGGDLDLDGDVDVVVVNRGGRLRLWQNRGDGDFTDGTRSAGLHRSRGAKGCTIGDLNGDGRFDLLLWGVSRPTAIATEVGPKQRLTSWWRGLTSGRKRPPKPLVHVYYNYSILNNKSPISLRFRPGQGAPLERPTVATDVDNDGRVDLVAAAADRARVWVSPAAQPRLRLDAAPLWRLPARPLIGVTDRDGDGTVEMMVRSPGSGEVCWAPVTDAGRGNGLRLQLRGHGTNRAAVGALVQVDEGARRWIRQVGLVSGAQLGPGQVVVGVGETMRVERVTVRWPDGTRQRFVDIPVGTRVELVQGGGARWGDLPDDAPAAPQRPEPNDAPEQPTAAASTPPALWALVVSVDGQDTTLDRLRGAAGTIVLVDQGQPSHGALLRPGSQLCRRIKRSLQRKVAVLRLSSRRAEGALCLPDVMYRKGKKAELLRSVISMPALVDAGSSGMIRAVVVDWRPAQLEAALSRF